MTSNVAVGAFYLSSFHSRHNKVKVEVEFTTVKRVERRWTAPRSRQRVFLHIRVNCNRGNSAKLLQMQLEMWIFSHSVSIFAGNLPWQGHAQRQATIILISFACFCCCFWPCYDPKSVGWPSERHL